jgi:hypothetical protein
MCHIVSLSVINLAKYFVYAQLRRVEMMIFVSSDPLVGGSGVLVKVGKGVSISIDSVEVAVGASIATVGVVGVAVGWVLPLNPPLNPQASKTTITTPAPIPTIHFQEVAGCCPVTPSPGAVTLAWAPSWATIAGP